MDECLVLSIVDIQIDEVINKKEVIAYVMLGDVTVDSLILGAPHASLQD
jgi:hypothetical protein